MALELHISRRAAREIERVIEWWAVNRPAAPGAVRKDFEAALGLLLVQPDIGSAVQEASPRRSQFLTHLCSPEPDPPSAQLLVTERCSSDVDRRVLQGQ